MCIGHWENSKIKLTAGHSETEKESAVALVTVSMEINVVLANVWTLLMVYSHVDQNGVKKLCLI